MRELTMTEKMFVKLLSNAKCSKADTLKTKKEGEKITN